MTMVQDVLSMLSLSSPLNSSSTVPLIQEQNRDRKTLCKREFVV